MVDLPIELDFFRSIAPAKKKSDIVTCVMKDLFLGVVRRVQADVFCWKSRLMEDVMYIAEDAR